MKFAICGLFMAALWVCPVHGEVVTLEHLDLSMKQMKHQMELIQVQRKQDHEMLQSFLNYFQREMKMSRRHQQRDRLIAAYRAQATSVDETLQRGHRSSRARRSANLQTSSENAAKSIGWLFSAVRELKNEFVEFSKSYDGPLTSQRFQELEKELQFVKNDVGSLAHRLGESKAAEERLSVEMEQVKRDVTDVSSRNDKLQSEIQLLLSEVTSIKQTSTVQASSPAPVLPIGRLRHSHVTAELQTFGANLEKVTQALDKLQTEITNTSSTLASLSNDWSALKLSVQDLTSITSSLGLRTEGTEIQLALLTEQVANATVSSATLAKLEASQVTLQDNVQLIQEEFDYEVRDLRNLLAKVHANSTHVVGVADKLLLQQQVDQGTLDQVLTDVSKLKDGAEKQRNDLTLLQNQVLNLTLKDCYSLNNQLTQELGYKAMELEIGRLSKEVQSLNQTMENFASAFSFQTNFIEPSLGGATSTTTTGHVASTGSTLTLTESTTENTQLLSTSTEKTAAEGQVLTQQQTNPNPAVDEEKGKEKDEDNSSSSSEESSEGS